MQTETIERQYRISVHVEQKNYECMGSHAPQCQQCGGWLRTGKRRCLGCAILDHASWPANAKDACWPWCGAVRNGYGVVAAQDENAKRKIRNVSRVAYATWIGPLPLFPFLEVRRTCQTKNCINPDHLHLPRANERLGPIARFVNDVRPGGERVWGDVHG